MNSNMTLILTVGGSYQPLLKSIQSAPGAHIHFLCSEDRDRVKGSYQQVVGSGNVLKSSPEKTGPDLPNLATLAGLPARQFQVHRIEHFDDLNECYLAALAAIEDARTHSPDARIVVDYTGGTKSMSAGLAAAALDDGRCEIRLVSGMRANLEKVADQTEFVRPVRVLDVQARRRLAYARVYLERFDYASAARVLEDALARYTSEEMEHRVATACSLCRAFDAWDRFDHAAARQMLAPIPRELVARYTGFLTLLLENRGHGFELVEDLLRNAERRAAQERYDDAVGRLYRAAELTAQQWLKLRHEIDTSDLPVERLPDRFRAELSDRGKLDRSGPVEIGLRDAWRLIACFPNDPLGDGYSKIEKPLLDFLTVRNRSLFAHGTTPIGKTDYLRHGAQMSQFLADAIDGAVTALGRKRFLELAQFPQSFPEQ